jgi:hypothetical protein
MDPIDELQALLRAEGWERDEYGDYVRGPYYVAILTRGIIHVGNRPPDGARPDTNKWGLSRTAEEAMAWIRERSRET